MDINPLFEDTALPRPISSFPSPQPPSSPPLPPEPLGTTEVPLSPFESALQQPSLPSGLPPRPPRSGKFIDRLATIESSPGGAATNGTDPSRTSPPLVRSPSILKTAASRDLAEDDAEQSGLPARLSAAKRNVSWADLSNSGAALTQVKEYSPECPPGSPMSDGSWGSDHAPRGCACSIM